MSQASILRLAHFLRIHIVIADGEAFVFWGNVSEQLDVSSPKQTWKVLHEFARVSRVAAQHDAGWWS